MLLKRIGRRFSVKMGPRRREKRKRFEALVRVVHNYCTNTTLHGLRYIADSRLHAVERLYWLIIFTASAIIANNIIYMLAIKYQTAPTLISIDTMHYKISSIPFPSVTLCPDDRIDWNKLMELEKRLFPNSTDTDTLKTFRDMMVKLSMMSFGDFDEMEFLRERRLDGLIHLNVTEILQEVVPSCEGLFSECWWRARYRNCCEVFELQRTEYGFCYSFNSQMSVPVLSKARLENRDKSGGQPEGVFDDEIRPRRAFGYGDWSGIKLTIHLGNITRPPASVELGGMIVMLSDPGVWPNSGTILPAGSLATVSMDCFAGYATEPVIELDQKRRPCKHLATSIYKQETCLSFCKQRHVFDACGCSPLFYFPTRMEDCNITDFLCLVDHNDLFNDYYVTDDENEKSKNTMICDCPPECEYYMYIPQYAIVPLSQSKNILLDVHYAAQTCFRYKTDIVFTNLDLLVSFGSIIGLFLGGSLLSAAELIYYLMVAVFCYVRSHWWASAAAAPTEPRVLARADGRPVATVAAWPILDYRPVKPRSTRIPNLANYGPVKTSLNRY